MGNRIPMVVDINGIVFTFSSLQDDTLIQTLFGSPHGPCFFPERIGDPESEVCRRRGFGGGVHNHFPPDTHTHTFLFCWDSHKTKYSGEKEEKHTVSPPTKKHL
mmetsp:Transcript_40400/g.48432  ORF Transcript_40400/g.48432 Transcript_40400/m.48432 type:complete len:104 (+) Transcript_40400:1945-2256(+)